MGFAEDSIEVKCFEKKMVEECDAHSQTFITNDPEDLKERFRYSFQACLLRPEHSCSQTLMTAQKIGGAQLRQIEKKIQDYCEQEQLLCDSLASLYEDKGKHKEALKFALVHYHKHGSGLYPELEFKYGNKEKAYKAMLESCEKDGESCQYTFRYYPNHPQRKKIIENAEKHCRSESEERSGASDCIDLGIYYFDRNQKEKGIELIDLNCKKNNSTACQALIGLEDTIEKKDQAFKRFCSALAQSNAIYSQPINRFCDEGKSQKINDEIIQSSQKMIDSWRQQIKTK